MKNILICAAFCVFAASLGFAEAEVSQQEKSVLSLTVEDAVSYALKNSKSLKSSAIDLEIAKRASDNSWNTFLPSLSASATVARQNNIESTVDSANSAAYSALKLRELDVRVNGANSTDPFAMLYGTDNAANFYSFKSGQPVMSDNETNHWAVIGNASAQWNFNLAMIDAIKIAKKNYEAGEITWEQATRETEVNIRKMFYGLLVQQENLNIQKDSLNNAQARWKQAERQYNNGSVPRLQMLNARVTYENKKPDVLSAEQGLKQNKDLFAFLLGLPYGQDIDLVGGLEFSYVDVDADKLFKDYIDQNKDILSLQKNMEILELSIRAKKLSTFTPSLSIGWSYQPTLYAAGEKMSDIGPFQKSDGGNLSFTLVYSNLFNMLPFSSNMQEIKDLKQKYNKVQLGMDQLYQNSEIEIHKLCDKLDVAKENIQAMERNVTLAQEAYESTLKAYNAGQTERLELQDSEESLNKAKLGLMSQKNEYISTLLDLETKLNISLK